MHSRMHLRSRAVPKNVDFSFETNDESRDCEVPGDRSEPATILFEDQHRLGCPSRGPLSIAVVT